MYGHDQPGDGFTAGVIVGLVVAFWYVVFGYSVVKARLNWLKPMPLIASGILLAFLSGILGMCVNGEFLSNVDIGAQLSIPLPKGFNLSTSFLFELAIFLSILGSITYILSALGHPRISDSRSQRDIDSVDLDIRANPEQASASDLLTPIVKQHKNPEDTNFQR
jgi:multicomponent K+:H+ antiporter subunit A